MRAAAYIRRSTKDQAQSLERQRHEIERFAADQQIEIVRWFEDDGISGTEDALRPGFCAMVDAAERHRNFDLILVHEISRFGRFDSHRLGSWLNRLRAAGVKVQAIGGSVRDPYSREGKILAALETDRQESRTLSMRTLSGQRETATKGLRAGGKVPYGYARTRRRPDGSVELLGRVGRAKRDKSEVIELVPGDPIEVEAIKTIFQWANEGSGYRAIASRLNDRGVPSPDAARQKTIATIPGRWTATTVRALLLNPAYVGDAVWNVRSMPKFHRLEGEKIVEIDDFAINRLRKNARADWITVPDAHPALVDRATYAGVMERIQSRPPMLHGHVHEYLLTGLATCMSCGDVMTGITRVRRKVVGGAMRTYQNPVYVCGGTLRSKGCRQIGIPVEGLERAVLRILDDEVFSPEGLARLEEALRRALAVRESRRAVGSPSSIEKQERVLAQRVADGARRLLQVDEALVPEIKAALFEMKEELERLRDALKSEKRSAKASTDGEGIVARTVAALQSMATLLRDPSIDLDRRRAIVRKLLPAREGDRPIKIYFDQSAGRGWRRAMRRATVRHLSVRRELSTSSVVAGAGFEPATSGL